MFRILNPSRIHRLLRGTLPAYVPDPPALVAGLGASIRAVLHNMPNLIAIVTCILVLTAISCDMPSAVTLVATIFFLSTLASKMSKSEG